MPEGDTIHRAARTLHAALAGRTITRFETVFPQLARVEMTGRTVERVDAAGKNLLMHFSGDVHLRTHMRMNGSWHVYRPGERWRKRFSDMRIVVETDAWVAVAFNVPVAEMHDSCSLERQDDLLHIGPDFLGETFDFDEATRRIRARPDEEIADVLLNQRVVAGIGNEYKSELLFMTGVNPFAKVREVTDEQLERILKTSRKVMQANVAKSSAARITTFSLDPSAKQYVYGRGRKPCRRCGTPVEYAKQGKDARGTYWCPRCQAKGAS
ncbi:MAG TPA: DNA-formamidopyrimidine glycosylase family protein [Thermoanaerobaculia bacterium]|jgi:endonuclease-8|nr:DNA-formamidopyrimidine glycosylase family protein [Thermoanaerobaculia bacterium]